MRKTATGPGRPREFDEDDVLSKIMNIFWAQGYDGTSLSDLMRATGLQKGSLYAAFGPKQSMYQKALEHYHAKVVAPGAAMLSCADNARLRLLKFLSSPAKARFEGGDIRGCFLCNAAADLQGRDENIAGQIEASRAKLTKALATALTDAYPNSNTDMRGQYAAFLLTLYFGLRVLSKTTMERQSMDDSVQSGLQALDAALN